MPLQVIREVGCSLGLRCGSMWSDEPGCEVCSSSVWKVLLWCWEPMSGLFNMVNDHTEDSKSKNGIKPSVAILEKCTGFQNCVKFLSCFWEDRAVLQSLPSINESVFPAKEVCTWTSHAYRHTYNSAHSSVSAAMAPAPCIHLLTAAGQPCPGGMAGCWGPSSWLCFEFLKYGRKNLKVISLGYEMA